MPNPNSLPRLNELKAWLEDKVPRRAKGSLTRKAMEYTLNQWPYLIGYCEDQKQAPRASQKKHNQWPYLIGYCEDGRLNISNVNVENAIRPFAVGRKAGLFADTAHGAHASATIYSLIGTAKANGLEPYAYMLHVLNHIGAADSF